MRGIDDAGCDVRKDVRRRRNGFRICFPVVRIKGLQLIKMRRTMMDRHRSLYEASNRFGQRRLESFQFIHGCASLARLQVKHEESK